MDFNFILTDSMPLKDNIQKRTGINHSSAVNIERYKFLYFFSIRQNLAPDTFRVNVNPKDFFKKSRFYWNTQVGTSAKHKAH